MVIRRMAWGRPGKQWQQSETGGLASEGLSGLVPDHAAACAMPMSPGPGRVLVERCRRPADLPRPAARDAGHRWRSGGRTLLDLFAHDEADGERSLRFVLARRTRFERLIVRSGSGASGAGGRCRARRCITGQFVGFHGHCADISDQRRDAEETSRLALHDPLTGLANRRHMTRPWRARWPRWLPPGAPAPRC
jgi:hypothetical protein